MEKILQPFTVIGLLPDSEWTGAMREASFIKHIEATSPEAAAHAARLAAARKMLASAENQQTDPPPDEDELAQLAESIEILLIFEGQLTPCDLTSSEER